MKDGGHANETVCASLQQGYEAVCCQNHGTSCICKAERDVFLVTSTSLADHDSAFSGADDALKSLVTTSEYCVYNDFCINNVLESFTAPKPRYGQ